MASGVSSRDVNSEGVTSESIGRGYSATAADYDAAVRHNIEGAYRLVAAMPEGRYGSSTSTENSSSPNSPPRATNKTAVASS